MQLEACRVETQGEMLQEEALGWFLTSQDPPPASYTRRAGDRVDRCRQGTIGLRIYFQPQQSAGVAVDCRCWRLEIGRKRCVRGDAGIKDAASRWGAMIRWRRLHLGVQGLFFYFLGLSCTYRNIMHQGLPIEVICIMYVRMFVCTEMLVGPAVRKDGKGCFDDRVSWYCRHVR